MNVSINLRSFVISLMDDIDINEYPIISLNIHQVNVELSTEEGTDDPVTFILKKMAIYKYPVMKAKAQLHLGANYFNKDNGAYEPLIEPWNLSFMLNQKDKGSSQVMSIDSDKMLNINLTYGMAIALKIVFDALDQDTDDWVDEVYVEEIKKNLTTKIVNVTNTSHSNMKSEESNAEESKVGSINCKFYIIL